MDIDIFVEKILILDFGSQYTQLIARRVREAKVYCEIHPFNMDLEAIRAFSPRGIILSGGPASIYDADAPFADKVFLIWISLYWAFVTACSFSPICGAVWWPNRVIGNTEMPP